VEPRPEACLGTRRERLGLGCESSDLVWERAGREFSLDVPPTGQSFLPW
jgi:hypothetical protein